MTPQLQEHLMRDLRSQHRTTQLKTHEVINLLLRLDLNAFGLQLFIESYLRKAQVMGDDIPSLDFIFPIDRIDCPNHSGVLFTATPIRKDTH